MPTTRIPSPTVSRASRIPKDASLSTDSSQKRGVQRPPSAASDAAQPPPTSTRPRRPSVKDIIQGVVAQQRPPSSAKAGPPSSFRVPPKPEQPSKPRSSSLGRSSSTSTSLQGSRAASPTKPETAGKHTNFLRRSSSQSRPSPAPRRPSNSSSTAVPMQHPAPQPTPQRGHARSSSLQESSVRKPSAKPVFSTFQQQFTPAKKLPTSTVASQQRTVASATSSPRATPAPARTRAPTNGAASPKAPAQNLEQLRVQTHLLHLTLLHRDFQPTYDAWASSAHDKLAARFSALQANYTSSLTLARSMRQARNILALHRWSNGNSATLTRKLSSLADIMRQVCDLTSPTLDGSSDDAEDCGEFLRLSRQFAAWSTFVQSVWAARDFRAPPRPTSSGSDNSPPWTPSTADFAPARRGRRLSRDERAADAAEAEADEEALDALAAQPIPGLGDTFKTSLRIVGAQVERLGARLDELRNPAIPLVTAPLPGTSPAAAAAETAATDEELDAARADAAADAIPTPRYVADMLGALVAGMRDEMQIMREAEFEVAIGERAWAESRVRGAARDVLGGWGTPGGQMSSNGASRSHVNDGRAARESPWGPPPLAATLAGGF